MVEAQRRCCTQGLGVARLRLLMGTSMGCMHGFVWAEAHPDFSRRAMPLACLPVEIAGRNRMWRELAIEGIRQDPAWQGGNYTTQPVQGLRAATSLLQVAGCRPALSAARLSRPRGAETYIDERIARDLPTRDANDLIYQLEASRTYNPRPHLARIVTPMTWVNSGDDFINPPDYGIAEETARQMPGVRYILIRATTETRGHGTHTWARFWRQELIDLLARTEGESIAAAPSSSHG